MLNYTQLWFVSARKASLRSVVVNRTIQFIHPFEDVKLPNSLKKTKQQLPKLPKLNYQCNHGIPSHDNISKAPITIKPFSNVFTSIPQVQVPIHTITSNNNLMSEILNSTYSEYNMNTNICNNHLQSTAMDLTKSTTSIVLRSKSNSCESTGIIYVRYSSIYKILGLIHCLIIVYVNLKIDINFQQD